MKIEYLSLNEIIHYERNAKLHPDSQVAKIAKSITEFGFRNPVLIDQGNEIIAGHARCLAARQAGLDEVPVIRAEDLTPEQVRAYRIADNKLAEGDWDQELLKIEITHLQEYEFDVNAVGFGEDELNELINKKTLLDIYQEDGQSHTSRSQPWNALMVSIGSFVHYADRTKIDFDDFRKKSETAQQKSDEEKLHIATKLTAYAVELFS